MKEKKRMMKSGKPKVRMEMCTTWRTKNQLMPIHRVESDQFSTFEEKKPSKRYKIHLFYSEYRKRDIKSRKREKELSGMGLKRLLKENCCYHGSSV